MGRHCAPRWAPNLRRREYFCPIYLVLFLLHDTGVVFREVKHRSKAHPSCDHAETWGTCWLIAQRGVKVIAPVAQSPEDAVCVRTVDTSIALVLHIANLLSDEK